MDEETLGISDRKLISYKGFKDLVQLGRRNLDHGSLFVIATNLDVTPYSLCSCTLSLRGNPDKETLWQLIHEIYVELNQRDIERGDHPNFRAPINSFEIGLGSYLVDDYKIFPLTFFHTGEEVVEAAYREPNKWNKELNCMLLY
jgi:hypothetical protein